MNGTKKPVFKRQDAADQPTTLDREVREQTVSSGSAAVQRPCLESDDTPPVQI